MTVEHMHTKLWYIAWWQRHMCVNNLPRVITWKWKGRESRYLISWLQVHILLYHHYTGTWIMGWRPSVVGWGIVRLMAAQLRVQSPLRSLWALLTCAAWRTTYYSQCQSVTTSTIVKRRWHWICSVKRRYTKYLGFSFSITHAQWDHLIDRLRV